MLQLWWGITEQTYLYYWHHKAWAVLAAWTLVVLFVVLIVLTGEELWRAGYRSALRSVSTVEAPPRPAPPPLSAHEVEHATLTRETAIPRPTIPGVSGYSRIVLSWQARSDHRLIDASLAGPGRVRYHPFRPPRTRPRSSATYSTCRTGEARLAFEVVGAGPCSPPTVAPRDCLLPMCMGR